MPMRMPARPPAIALEDIMSDSPCKASETDV